MRTRNPDAKRQALLDAGVVVADEHGLGQLSVNRVTATAGVAKGSFFHHFGDRARFLVALHRRFHDRLEGEIEAAVRDLTPGRWRLLAGTGAYLDGCRHDRGTRALLLEARAEPAVAAEVSRRNEQFAALVVPDFVALGRATPAAAAQLWVVMAAEVAVAESVAGEPVAELRAALADYARRPVGLPVGRPAEQNAQNG